MPISSHELKHFLSKCFVECGSAGQGHGISAALFAGFTEVHSVEIDSVAYKDCYALFGHDKRVHLSHDDCGKWLDKTLDMIAEPCTIYLDANGWAGETESPFHSSIEALVRHGRKDHIILVDDANHGMCPRNDLLDTLRQSKTSGPTRDVIKQLLRINPAYSFYLLDTHTEDLLITYPSWVLVADPISARFPGMTLAEYV